MPGHGNIRPWLVFYAGTWDSNLSLYPLSISHAPEPAFLIHYSTIFLKTLVNQGGAHTSPCSLKISQEYLTYRASGLSCLVFGAAVQNAGVAEDLVKMEL